MGERIVVPISEIKQRITNNPYELKGFCKSFNHSGEEFAEFYLPNGSHLVSDQGALNLSARDALDFNFASIFAGAGLYTQSSFLNWLNVHGIVLGEWQDQSQKVLYHRTPSHVIEGDVYKYALQTSEVTRLLIMGNCTSTTPAFEVIGADILIAGGICLNGQHYTSGEEIKRHHKVAALEHCCRLRDGYQMNLTCNSSDLQRAVLFRAVVARRNEWRCLQGTSGGTLMCGQGLSLTRDDLICVGGGVTAQLIDVNLNRLHLEALRATLPRAALPTVGLDKTTERLAKDNPVIQRTERGTLTMDPQGAMPTETKTAPFWDERAQRFTTTYPTNVPFYLDNALEAIAFTEQMNVNTQPKCRTFC
ncbi:hypothetical protein [Candidatus Odyssella thessalonicensis]|uniref:hypothetical protein n=1 Tax=Candidatus Odyssella thessalonicensis TaxID=84647 RepID=UPI0002FD00E1|nr:hypothetical protein [Candidatus Odyssella thessalonicensis]